jgi:hypothetical protein
MIRAMGGGAGRGLSLAAAALRVGLWRAFRAATWVMLMVGFGGLGYRRSRNTAAATA